MLLFVLPTNVDAYSEIDGARYPTEVHQESPKIIEVDVANYGYYDEDYFIRIYLRYPDQSEVKDDKGRNIKVGETMVFTVPARTTLTDKWVFIYIPSTVPLGQYLFYFVLYKAGTAFVEDDSISSSTFTLLEPIKPREPVPSFEAIYLLAIIGICVILLKGGKKKRIMR
ncbi:MAG: hypothetical protein KKA79_10245 [Nanoarchaeota archaeon]|nr:hypothetical protein [Nanoarchaeota archaeon]